MVFSVPGFWASTTVSTFQGVSRGFAKSPESGPLSCAPLPRSILPGVSRALAVPLDSGPLQRFPLSTAFPMGLQSPRILGLYSDSHFSLRFPWFFQWPRIPGLDTGSHFPQSFPWFSSDPGFRASTLISITLHAISCDFAESPDSGPLQLFPLFHCVSYGFAVCPDSGPLQRFPLSTVFPMGVQCPRVLGLYKGFLFPGRFPWVCSVPGFWASTTVSTGSQRLPGFLVSPDSGPLQRFSLSTVFYHGFVVPPVSGPLQCFPRRSPWSSTVSGSSAPEAFSCLGL